MTRAPYSRRSLRAQVLDLFTPETSNSGNATGDAPSLTRPRLPLVKRLNRNALTVAAVVMGMTVIACLVVLRGDSGPARAYGASSEPTLTEASTPSFLDRQAPGSGGTITPRQSTTWPAATMAQVPSTTATPPQGATTPAGAAAVYLPSPSTSIGVSTPAGGTVGGVADPRQQAFDAALRRSAVSRGDVAGADGGGGTTPSGTSALASDESKLIAYGDSMLRSATQTGGASASVSGSPAANPRRAFMQQAGDLGGRSVIARIEPAATPYVLRAGTVIPGILLTAITSDLPGDCLGQVTRDVYDSQSQRIILIPKGSKLMCRYDDQIVAGQGRLLVAWTRLLLPDGRSMTLPGLALKDEQGQTGAKGDVDNHTRRVFGRALLLSAIGAGAQLSQPRQVTVLAAPTTGQVMAGAAGQELSNVALEILRRGMDQPPTITLPQGQTFNVFLNGDLVFDGPYTAANAER